MRLRALCATIAGVALAGSTLAVAAVPAEAATLVPTRIVSATAGKPFIYDSSYRDQPGAPVYGDNLSMNINVQAFVDGAWKQIYNGPLTVTRKIGAASALVASSTSPYLYSSTTALGTATYTVNYGGGSGYAAGSVPVDYAPATLSGSLQVQRKLHVSGFSGRKAGMIVKVGPKFRGNVVILKKVGKTWKRFKIVRTNANSRVRVVLPAPRRGKFFWRVKINAGGGFALTQSGTYYTRKF